MNIKKLIILLIALFVGTGIIAGIIITADDTEPVGPEGGPITEVSAELPSIIDELEGTEYEEAETTNEATGEGFVDVLRTNPFPLEMSFAHTNPGVSSEVYLTQKTTPNTDITAVLSLNGVEFNTKTITSDENGNAYFVFTIYEFGTYNAKVYDTEFSAIASVIVK